MLPRLLVDAVLPCALAAWMLIGVLTFLQVQAISQHAQLGMALQLQQLDMALVHANDQTTQALLDAAVRDGRADDLKGIELDDAGGGLIHSGLRDSASLEHYSRELPVRDGHRRRLTAHVDPAPRRHAQFVAGVYALCAGLGVLMLVWLAIHALRRSVVRPLRRLQRTVNDAILGTSTLAGVAEAHTEFAQLQEASATLGRLLQARGQEAALVLRDSRIEALDQRRQSQAALRSKSQFIALVGHHFRQPLQALQLFTGSLHPGIDEEQQALIAQMRRSMNDMTRLLDALLEISRLDAEVVVARRISISVQELFQQWRRELEGLALARSVNLRWHPGPHALQGDTELIGALLMQLVSNAVVYSPGGGTVMIAARRRGDWVRVEVRDHGLGIAAIHHQRIFEEFVRLPDEGERHPGYGLGLAIASRLTHLLQGRLGLRSEPGRGSTFFVELPCVSVDDEPAVGLAELRSAQAVESAAPESGGAGTRARRSMFRPSSERAMS
ncbi:MAG: HAMP domain-containing sensor histidine kinase [Rhodanobacter sp.]